MNQKLQNILDIIQQSDKLDAKQKANLLKAVKDADKELEITAFKLERTEKVKKTTSILLEETIEELEQKRKAVEAQNRELEIESALERVRTVAMGMQKPDDLLKICEVTFKEFEKLGFETMRNVIIHVPDDKKTFFMDYDYSETMGGEITKIEYGSHPIVDEYMEKINSAKEAYFEVLIKEDQLKGWREFRKKTGQYDDPRLDEAKALYYYLFSIGIGDIGISTFESIDESQKNMLKRFRNVFDLAYRRYTDITRAEEQAREAQIQASLERVRASAMAMHTSEELLDICEAMFHEFLSLGFNEIRNAIINIHNDKDNSFLNYDYAEAAGKSINRFDNNVLPFVSEMMKISHSASDAFSETHIKGEALAKFIDLRRQTDQKDEPRLNNAESLYFYFYSIGIGAIGISTYGPINSEKKTLLKRFRDVFNLSYKRYIDISNAEAQAREARIEASLEKVRSRSLAMHKAEELGEVAAVVFEKLRDLNIPVDDGVAIVTHIEGSKDQVEWMEAPDYPSAIKVYVTYFDHPVLSDYWKAKNEGLDFIVRRYSADENKSFLNHIFEYSDYKYTPQEIKDYCLAADSYSYSAAFQKNSSIFINDYSGRSLSEQEIDLVKRFAKVFEQAYVRFLDLQKAETQAREARIEASLEIVRSLALGMHKSEEVGNVTDRLFEELNKIILKVIGCTIVVIDEDKDRWETWRARTKMAVNPLEIASYKRSIEIMKKNIPDWFPEFYAGLGSKNSRLIKDMSGESRIHLLNSIAEQYEYSDEERARLLEITPEKFTAHFLFFKLGYLAVITEEQLPEENLTVTRRFVEVFDFAYTRFLDIKRAEEQAREAEIELALERVRARTMAMQRSDELKEVIQLVYEQFIHLKINIEHTGFILDYKTRDDLHLWLADQREIPSEITIPCFDSPPNNSIREAKEKGQDFFSYLLTFEEKNKFYKELFEFIPGVPEESVEYYFNCPGLAGSGVLLDNVGLYIENFSGTPYTDEDNNTLMRIGRVFQQTYTRFLDLQKAEAQARESEIQLALERVRARTMAMHKSNELAETAAILFQQMTELGVTPERLNICLIKEEANVLEVWATDQQGTKISHHFNASLDEPTTGKRVYDAWKEKKKSIVIDLSGEELNNWIRYVREEMGMTIKPELVREHRIHSVAFFSQGLILTTTPEPLPKESIKLLERFADVFNLTYRRFLDLQKAEAQAREAEIQLALERVRARTMAMQHSSELSETASIFFKQLSSLGIETNRLYIGIFNDDSGMMKAWGTSEDGSTVSSEFFLDSKKNKSVKKMYNGWKEQKKSISIDMRGKELSDYIQYIADEVHVPVTTGYSQHRRVQDIAYFSKGLIGLASPEPQPVENINLLERFAKVFDQTYTRFQDLQKAEARVREAQIEAALERVRTRSIAMHKSDELKDVVRALYKEFKILVTDIDSVNIQLNLDSSKDIHFLASVEEDIYPELYHLPYSDLPIFEKFYNAFNSAGDGYFEYSPNKKEKDAFFREVFKIQPVPPKRKKMIQNAEGMVMIGWFHQHSGIDILRYNLKHFSEEEKNIVKRFAAAFEQTYIRFLDLQKAEAQAREAIKQASLDRVRGEIASMRNAEDLNRITPLIWRELTTLEVPFIRCGVFIIDEDNEITQIYLTTPEGKPLGVLNLPFDTNELTINTVKYWRKKEVYKEYWDKQAFINWTKSMMELGQIQNAETYQGSATPPESLHLNFVPFAQGMLYVGDVSPLTEEKLDLVKTLAEAFAIAYARYEDFKNLEEAKNKIEITLNELKAAQAQLVHSEKMASLGELTAGIAHEIKNPLNFVNNFSEISGELLDELNEELEKNNKEEVLALLNDLKQNLEKINQHGRRADSIIKGMLLHSRGTAGEKTLTDINDLLDQYVNLAYHGMRAQNKEFNITIEKDYDESLEKISVVPQDISRVFLNIINNACYAANERKLKSGSDFSPLLKVSTKGHNGKVEIRIKDNGNGIPSDISDKIFQPFFTTKPTGEGTGLGLSLSYDIITKVHSGELKLETEEGVGTEFSIILNK